VDAWGGRGAVTRHSPGFDESARHILRLALRASFSTATQSIEYRRYATPADNQPSADVDPIGRDNLGGRAGSITSQRSLT
jgi:hypothetical protein